MLVCLNKSFEAKMDHFAHIGLSTGVAYGIPANQLLTGGPIGPHLKEESIDVRISIHVVV